MTAGMSFVVCCHNSACRLSDTLAHLAAQRVPAGAAWEVVLVDNASTDSTVETARRIWGVGPAPLRFVEEGRHGLTRARLAGAAAARYDAMTLVDDDNWLAPDWSAVALDALRAHPEAGALGGQSAAVPEIPPPVWFLPFAENFAVGAQAPASGDVTKSRGYLWGAGLVIRRAAWEDLLGAGFEFLLGDRTGGHLRSGGDTEICHGLRLRGWSLRYEADLFFRHFVPETRLRWRYFRRLFRSFGAASVVLDTYRLALRERERRDVAECEYSWRFRMRAVREEILRSPLAFARALVFDREGVADETAKDYKLGQLSGLLRTRRTLPTITRKIRGLPARSVSPVAA
jgi:glycosyltransferase involved in cell wall biosynthesis